MPYSSDVSLVSTSCSSIDSQATVSDTDASHHDVAMRRSSDESLVSSSCSSIDSQATISDTDASQDDVTMGSSEVVYSSDDDNYHDFSGLKDGNNNNSHTNSQGNINSVQTIKGKSSVEVTELTSVQMEVRTL